MGVPGFFASLIKKYNFVIPYILDNYINCHELYFDTNCLIHPICMEVFKNNSDLENNFLEDKMIKAIIDYIEEIIALINPKELVYLAIDGVAPLAKIKHQRIRRYRSIKEQEIKENIAKKHKVSYTKIWNNSAITPGTLFMRKLTKAIISHIKIKKKNIKFIFSSCNTCGEGEHKILQYIKQNINDEKNRIIYGLDADLIYLALACMKNNIYLLREKQHFNHVDNFGFNLVNIDIMKKCICDEMNYDYKLVKQAIYDYIFLGFFLGNDFIPSLPSVNYLNMQKTLNGLEILMFYYSRIREEINETLITFNDELKINQNFLLKLFEHLADDEEEYFKKTYNKKRYLNYQSNKPYDIELFKLENLMFKIDDPIELGKINLNESKKKYYEYFKINNDIYNEYFKTLEWISYYYFDKCPDWLYAFPYDNAPFVSDIYDYLKSNKIIYTYPIDNNNYKSIKPIEQLLIVLPIQSSFLLPTQYKKLMENQLKDYYPKYFELEFILKKKFWQGIPKIVDININKVLEETKKIKLDDKYEKLNIFKKPFIL